MTDKRVVHSDLDYSGEPRHLLVFMDGTWNDENGIANDGITTNIYKLFRALEGEHKSENIPHTITHEKHIALYAWIKPHGLDMPQLSMPDHTIIVQ